VLVPRGGNPKTSVLGKRPYAWESIRKATPWLDSPWHHRDDVVSESRGDFFADKSQEDLYVCPGGGSTATHSLILALTDLGVENSGKKLDHFGHALQATTTAAEDDEFNWLLFDKFAGVSDTPIPGFWRELAEAYPRSKHLLTVRRHYHRSYPRRIETRQFGVESADWRRLAEGHFVRNIGYAFEPNWCYAARKSNCRGASPPLLNHDLHANDAAPARWRGVVVFTAPDSLVDVHAGATRNKNVRKPAASCSRPGRRIWNC